jgi:hypothetical protein
MACTVCLRLLSSSTVKNLPIVDIAHSQTEYTWQQWLLQWVSEGRLKQDFILGNNIAK